MEALRGQLPLMQVLSRPAEGRCWSFLLCFFLFIGRAGSSLLRVGFLSVLKDWQPPGGGRRSFKKEHAVQWQRVHGANRLQQQESASAFEPTPFSFGQGSEGPRARRVPGFQSSRLGPPDLFGGAVVEAETLWPILLPHSFSFSGLIFPNSLDSPSQNVFPGGPR